MKLIVIRHTSVDVPKGICYGSSNVKLKETFPEEFDAVISRLGDAKRDLIVTSPLTRCYKLAKEISLSESRIIADANFQELNFGDWEMTSWNRIFEQEHGKQWMDSYEQTICPNGESYNQMVDRIHRGLIHIKEDFSQYPEIILVAHAGVIRALHGLILNHTTDETFSMDIKYGQIFEFNI